MDAAPSPRSRWWTYQAERFPLAKHGPVIAFFSYSAVCFSRLLRTGDEADFAMPGPGIGLAAFVCCLGFFAQLRIADEHKDAAEDARHRPYRPVPRGLVTLSELTRIGLAIAAVQALVTVLVRPELLLLLAITWTYLALMTREFFVRRWLTGRPILSMTSHMAIVPLIDLHATGFDWLAAADPPPVGGLLLFLATSYANGVVLELGRKIRAPEDEEPGVETYSALWGRRAAAWSLIAMMGVASACSIAAASRIGFARPVAVVAAIGLAAGAVLAARFARSPDPGSGERFESLAGLWIILQYGSLGIAPAALRALA